MRLATDLTDDLHRGLAICNENWLEENRSFPAAAVWTCLLHGEAARKTVETRLFAVITATRGKKQDRPLPRTNARFHLPDALRRNAFST
jgi:hypothetical protein